MENGKGAARVFADANQRTTVSLYSADDTRSVHCCGRRHLVSYLRPYLSHVARKSHDLLEASDSLRMSIFHSVRRAAKRTLMPPLPIASES